MLVALVGRESRVWGGGGEEGGRGREREKKKGERESKSTTAPHLGGDNGPLPPTTMEVLVQSQSSH